MEQQEENLNFNEAKKENAVLVEQQEEITGFGGLRSKNFNFNRAGMENPSFIGARGGKSQF